MSTKRAKPSLLAVLLLIVGYTLSTAQLRPNILIIIADDMGIDALGSYGIGEETPSTPNIDRLSDQGILFNHAWGYPRCAPSRASLLTGRYGNKSGITKSGPSLPRSELTLFEHLEELTQGAYADALFGKWHLGNEVSPNNQGIDHFIGFMDAGVEDYFDWDRVENGDTSPSNDYVTTHLTDAAIEWVQDQTQPWLLWMAHSAPKGDHLPPDSLYTRAETATSLDRFLCRIESVDHEIGRLLDALSQKQLDSTLIIFLGDNGTANGDLQGFPAGHGKSSLYEGGIRLPMIVSGYGVTRRGEVEEGMIATTDVFATITELLGFDLPGGVHNSRSFVKILEDADADTRTYNYSEFGDESMIDRTVRDERYKLITRADSTREFYDLLVDPLEESDLYPAGLTATQQIIANRLQAEMDSIYYSWSCFDGILNGTEEEIDCGGSSCTPCETTSVKPLESSNLHLSIFPNPTRDVLTLKPEFNDTYSVELFNPSSHVVRSYASCQGQFQFDLGELPRGLYILRLTISDGMDQIVQKVVVY